MFFISTTPGEGSNRMNPGPSPKIKAPLAGLSISFRSAYSGGDGSISAKIVSTSPG
jgi:hypothetical protein